MKKDVEVYLSPYRDPLINLGIEGYFLERFSGGQGVLFLYENNECIVLGRFQNPWRECRIGLADRLGVPVLRRVSGGGTVINGPGNLNFSLISANSVNMKERTLERVCHALRSLGIPCRVNERFDMVTRPATDNSGKWYKFSGTALRQVVGRGMHHATLLVNAKLQRLQSLIRPPKRRIETGAIASVPSPVMNLSEVKPGLVVDSVIKALCGEWGADTPVLLNDLSVLSQGGKAGDVEQELNAVKRRMESFEWLWGKTPSFVEVFQNWPHGLAGGTRFLVKGGRIEGMDMQGAGERQMEKMKGLKGRFYRGKSVQQGLEGAFPADELELLSKLIEGENHPK